MFPDRSYHRHNVGCGEKLRQVSAPAGTGRREQSEVDRAAMSVSVPGASTRHLPPAGATFAL